MKDGTNLAAAIVSAAVLLAVVSMNTAAQSDNAATWAPSAVSPGAPMDAYESFQVRRVLRLSSSDTANALHIILPQPTETRQSASTDRNGPLQVAFDRDMPAEYESNLSSRMQWIPLEDGIVAGQALVTSPGATDMRMGVSVNLPPEAEIRFFGTDSAQTYGVVTRQDISWKGFKPQTLWSPVVDGETIGIEIVLPSRESISTLVFEIDGILHGFMERGGFRTAPQLCPSQVDAMCRSSSIDFRHLAAVSQISYRADRGGGYVCSGTMMNDSVDGHHIPYFLTANHCISSQTEARSIVARWWYLREICGQGAPIHPEYFETSFGANLLATNSEQDSTLLVFRFRSRNSHGFAGWSSAPVPMGREVYGLHHPRGTVMKYSAGKTIRFTDTDICEDAERRIGCFEIKNSIEVDWTDGLTEGGSSGSALLVRDAPGGDGNELLLRQAKLGDGGCHVDGQT